MPAYPQHFSSRSACICRRKLLLPQYSLAELCLFIAVDWEWCSDPGKTTGFWEPGHQPATPGQLSPMKPVLEAHKPSQNAVIASTAQVDQVASVCLRIETKFSMEISFIKPEPPLGIHGSVQDSAGSAFPKMLMLSQSSNPSVWCCFPVCHPSTSSGCRANPDPERCPWRLLLLLQKLWSPFSLTTSFAHC